MDFSALVLGPAMDAFAQSVTVNPVSSQPSAPTYVSRAVYSLKTVEILLEDGVTHSTTEAHLGFRLADYAVPPEQEDIIILSIGTFFISDINPDGQGGADAVLRQIV